jgi:hypothetical protein
MEKKINLLLWLVFYFGSIFTIDLSDRRLLFKTKRPGSTVDKIQSHFVQIKKPTDPKRSCVMKVGVYHPYTSLPFSLELENDNYHRPYTALSWYKNGDIQIVSCDFECGIWLKQVKSDPEVSEILLIRWQMYMSRYRRRIGEILYNSD